MLTHNEDMAKHCSFRAGGLAQKFFEPESIQALSDFLESNNLPVLIIGLGSNTLVRDRGFEGVVIKTSKLKEISITGNYVNAGAGLTLAKLSRYCGNNNFYGAEFLSSIPGTVGGALAMNAGAFGSEFWNYVINVTTIDSNGILVNREKSDFDIGYRYVNQLNSNEYFVAAKLKFNEEPGKQNIKDLLKKRNKLQPIGMASCGSVFKNPKNNYAAKLIEDCNLKGFCIGGACISEKHANFIINNGEASAEEIENLIKHIQDVVLNKYKINLETEVRII
jgi:UDP-N-acetylmuramate dehydrogenase